MYGIWVWDVGEEIDGDWLRHNGEPIQFEDIDDGAVIAVCNDAIKYVEWEVREYV